MKAGYHARELRIVKLAEKIKEHAISRYRYLQFKEFKKRIPEVDK